MHGCHLFVLVSVYLMHVIKFRHTSSGRMFNLDNVGSRTQSILNSSVLPTVFVGPYRAVHVVPKISQNLCAVRLRILEYSQQTKG